MMATKNTARCDHCGRFCAIDGATGKGQSGLYLIADEDGNILDWQVAICAGCFEKHDNLNYWKIWLLVHTDKQPETA
jgi:hypothetical protein